MRFKKLLWHSDADCMQLSTKTFPHPSSVHTAISTSTPFSLQDRHKGCAGEGHNPNSQVSSARQQNWQCSITSGLGKNKSSPVYSPANKC